MQKPLSPISVPELLTLAESEFIKHCNVQSYQASGPGGQKRNRTYSGIRLTLPYHNLEIKNCEDRSSAQNQKHAIHNLKIKLAVTAAQQSTPQQSQSILQSPMAFPGSAHKINSSNPQYPLFVYEMLTVLHHYKGSISQTAQVWNASSSALLKIAFKDKEILQAIQNIRRQNHLKPVKAPG